ncbi:MAG TPA: hypothetical protein VFC21_01015 [Bryobacteraceae bacterium]|nr:hypothetical protein [Bryobacteraceae bacterium]
MPRRVLGILALSGAIIGFTVSLLLPRQFVGRASITLTPGVSAEYAIEKTLSTPSLAAIVYRSPYYQPMLDYTPVEDLAREIRDGSSIGPDGRIQFVHDDKYTALDTARLLLDELKKNAGGAARVKDPVRLEITGPSRGLCTFEGMAAGLLLGLCVWFGVSRSA